VPGAGPDADGSTFYADPSVLMRRRGAGGEGAPGSSISRRFSTYDLTGANQIGKGKVPHLASLHGRPNPSAWAAATTQPHMPSYDEISPAGTPMASSRPSQSGAYYDVDTTSYGNMTSRGGGASGVVVNSAYRPISPTSSAYPPLPGTAVEDDDDDDEVEDTYL
jgi:hypothetical protein